MNHTAIADAIERDLRIESTEERATKEKAYLKSALVHIGTKVPTIRKITKRHVKVLESREHYIALAEVLWNEPIHERRVAAVEVLTFGLRTLVPGDIALLERLLRESKTWALVDAIAVGIVGPLVERHPELATTLDRWAEDEDFWIRRSAMLGLLRPLRRGEGDFERFCRYADAMLEEREFFIRKAIGWVLREAGKKTPDRVDAFIAPRAPRASGVTIREAVKVLPRRAARRSCRRIARPSS